MTQFFLKFYKKYKHFLSVGRAMLVWSPEFPFNQLSETLKQEPIFKTINAKQTQLNII